MSQAIYLNDVAKSENAEPIIRRVAEMMSNGKADPYIVEVVSSEFEWAETERVKSIIQTLMMMCPAGRQA